MDIMCRKGASQDSLVTEFEAYTKLLPDNLRGKYTTKHFVVLMRLIQIELGVNFTPSITTDVCENDCVLFRQSLRDHIMCPNFGCEAPRYPVDGSLPRRFTFIYLIPRLRRMYASPAWSRLLEYNARRIKPQAGWMSDILDGAAYSTIFGPNQGQLPESKYSLGWTFGADGLPISKTDLTYSVCPLLFHLCQLDPALRCLWDYLFCVGFTPGPGKNSIACLEPRLHGVGRVDGQLAPLQDGDSFWHIRLARDSRGH